MLSALPYPGGKSRSGQWIADRLPSPDRGQLYVEPFAGMLGVLLRREAAGVEIVGDADGDLVNWWRTVRDDSAWLERALTLTPRSRAEYLRGLRTLDGTSTDRRERALAFSIVATQQAQRPGSWKCPYSPRRVTKMTAYAQRIEPLAERLRAVQIDNRDACFLLERIARHDHAVIYCDPPYAGTLQDGYRGYDVDRDRLAELLLAQRGRVAISGFAGEWNRLGWRSEARTLARSIGPARGKKTRFTEVLWRNWA